MQKVFQKMMQSCYQDFTKEIEMETNMLKSVLSLDLGRSVFQSRPLPQNQVQELDNGSQLQG